MTVRKISNGSSSLQFVQVPLQLKSVVIPKLIKKLGGQKNKIISHQMVLNYLKTNKIMFDKNLLQEMFEEADFQKNGSQNEDMIFATISGRFPKRKHTQKWLELLQLILQEPKEILDSSMKIGGEALPHYIETRGPAQKTFNSDSLWETSLQDTTQKKHKNSKNYSQRSFFTTKITKEWTNLNNSQLSKQFSTLNYGLSEEIPLRTTQGIKSLQQIDDEFTINELIYRSVADRIGDRPQSTFKSTNWFENFDEGLKLNHELASHIKRDLKQYQNYNNIKKSINMTRPRTCPASIQRNQMSTFNSKSMNLDNTKNVHGATDTINFFDSFSENIISADKQNFKHHNINNNNNNNNQHNTINTYNGNTNWQEFALTGAIKQSISSPLKTLRSKIKNKVNKKPMFEIYHRPLTVSDLTFKNSLGQQFDMSGENSTMGRIFPVKGKLLNSDGYEKWADYAPRCPTNPERWDAHHPSMIVQF